MNQTRPGPEPVSGRIVVLAVVSLWIVALVALDLLKPGNRIVWKVIAPTFLLWLWLLAKMIGTVRRNRRRTLRETANE